MVADDAPRILPGVDLAIDPSEVLRFQGYKAGGEPPSPDVMALFDGALALGRQLMAPSVVVRWLAASPRGADALDVAGEVLTIPGIGARWGPVEAVAVAVCTIGAALEGRVRALWEGRELPLAAMLDSVGSGATESLAEYANDVLCQEGLGRGLRVTNRISPGYGAWDVGEQEALFRLCPGASIGVTLNAACFMTPEKSLTFLAGAGRAARVDDYFSQCARCWMAACAYRRGPARRSVKAGARAPHVGPGQSGTIRVMPLDNVILVGFMGAGKSTVGRVLARRLGRCFVETDDVIAAREGRAVPEIFREDGEARFRQLEGETLEALALKAGDVIATGGGLPCRDGRMAALRALGTVIWLKGDLDVALERARRSGARPMLAGRAPDEIEALYRQREPYYRDAHLTVDTTGLTIDQIVARILSLLRSGDTRLPRTARGGAAVAPSGG